MVEKSQRLIVLYSKEAVTNVFLMFSCIQNHSLPTLSHGACIHTPMLVCITLYYKIKCNF